MSTQQQKPLSHTPTRPQTRTVSRPQQTGQGQAQRQTQGQHQGQTHQRSGSTNNRPQNNGNRSRNNNNASYGMRSKRVPKNISKNWKKAPVFTESKTTMHATTTPRSQNANKLRIAVLGGAEEVGRNMTMLEYGNDIIFIDAGLQFPEEEMPGIDYIIPNVEYLKGKEKNIRGIIVTHAHYDHIGAIPHLAPILHNPPIFSARLTLGIIAKRQDDFPNTPKLDLREVDIDGKLKLGDFTVEFIRINHSVPDSLAIVVRTPEGIIVHTGDFKFDLQPIGDQVTDFAKMTRIGEEGILALLADSTNASKPGQQKSETYIGKTIEGIMEKAEGRIIVGTFASNLNRVQQLLWSAETLGRFVVLEGHSMRTNVEIARQLGYVTVDSKTIITGQEAVKLPPHKVIIVGTGAQGEENASLMRMATGGHRFFKVEAEDMVIFSSSVIPGNERSVQNLKDMLIRQGAKIVHYQMMDVHAGGHAQEEDLKLLLRMMKPKYYVPIEGNLHLLHDNAQIALELEWPKDQVFITSNGQVMEFSGGSGVLTKEMLPADYVFVDGLGVGDVSEVVLRDRQALSEDGMIIVIVSVSAREAKLIGEPDIISRGFIYMKDNKVLIDEMKKKVAEIVHPHMKHETPNPVYLKNKLRDELGQFLFQRIQRRPMILPVVVEV